MSDDALRALEDILPATSPVEDLAPEEEVLDLDTLLSDVPAVDPPAVAEVSAKAARIAELEAALAASPLVPEEPDADDLRIAALEAQIAERLGQVRVPGTNDVRPAPRDTILFHFLEDGITAFGQVWYRGQEVEVDRDSEQYKQQTSRDGSNWLELVGDAGGQYARWGRQVLGEGPWPGTPWGAADGLSEEEAQDAARALLAEQRRGRRAPLI